MVLGPCLPRQTRAILPMPSSLMLVDTVVALRCTGLLDGLAPPLPCFIEAAKKKRSTNDVVFASRLIVEKGLDDKSKTCLVVGDIERFYDGVDPILTAEFFEGEGLDCATSTAFARLHLCVGVSFMMKGTLFSILQRAGAVLTGTRTSVVGGRAVIFGTGRSCAPQLKTK